MITKFLLDSGDPQEYKQIAQLAKDNGSEIWGATTNPSLIAKNANSKLLGKKLTQQEAFELQKDIALEILGIVPGAVSVEVYSDQETKAEDMIKQGMEIASWHNRLVVKLPTTLEGLKARTALRQNKVTINNTLVFSQEQVFAICLHEKLTAPDLGLWPCFISPFVGRLDDIGQNGMDLVRNSMLLKQKYGFNLWMLEASVRSMSHMSEGFKTETELITAPAKTYIEWFSLKDKSISPSTNQSLQPIPLWTPSDKLLQITTLDEFFKAIQLNELNINHPLTDQGIEKFVADWRTILA